MKKSILVTLATVALTVGLIRPAQAALFVSISDGSATVTCTFGGSCDPGFTQVNPNQINFAGNVGHIHLNSDVSSSNNPGAPGNASLDISTNGVSRINLLPNPPGTANTLFLWASQTGFMLPNGSAGHLGNSASASVSHDTGSQIAGDSFSAQSWVDTTNAAHNNIGNVGVAGAGVTNNGPCSGTATGATQSESGNCASPSVAFSNVVPFSLTQKDTIFITAQASGLAETVNTTGTTSVSANSVPEPGSLMLFGTGMVGLATIVRRRVRK